MTYDRLEREAASPKRVVDHSRLWEKLEPVASVNSDVGDRLAAFCASKRISVDALTALGARLRFRKSGAVELAFAGITSSGAVTAIKYRPLDGTSHDSRAEAPSTWLNPIIAGNRDSLDWLVVEGETDAARLYGLVGDQCAVLVLPAGAKTFKPEWADVIPRGVRVGLCHDADPDGDTGAEKAARIIAGTTFRVRPPTDGGDWCDWDGGRDDFLELVRRHGEQHIHWLAGYDLKEVEWIERPLLQVAFTLLCGRPGIGKGALVARWIARCTNGAMYGQPRPAILLSSEDDPEVDLGPRIEAAGGDRSLVAIPPSTFQLPRDIDWLRGYVGTITASRGEPGLIAIDPLGNHTGAANTDRDSEVRVALMPLAVLVHELHIPTLGVRHLSTKEAKGGALAKVLGSTAWIGVPRVVLAAVTDSTDPSIVHVHPIKGNRVARGESGRRFRLEGLTLPGFTESVVHAVEDGASDVDIDAELAGEKSEATASEKARELLVETLRDAGGRMESDQLDAVVAEATGLKATTVRNLRVELKDRGWLRSSPEKDETGAVLRWWVVLTNAAPDHYARGNALSSDLDYSSQVSRDLDHHITTSRGTREAGTGSYGQSQLTPEELAAAIAALPVDENGHLL